MHDRSYRWQDHVPPSVGWRADLLIAIAFIAGLALIGIERARSDQAQHQIIVRSIESAAPRHAASAPDRLFARGEPARTGATHLIKTCTLPQMSI